MLCCLAVGVVGIAIAAFAYWFRYHTDACWSLVFAEHFGTSPATLRKQVAWITGAGSGLGRAMALEFASHGVKVAISDIDEKAIEDVKYTLIGLPDSATYNGTKAALHGYFEGLWSEVFDKGINVTMVCPGPVATPIRQKCFTDTLDKTESFKPAAGKSNKMAPARAAQLIVLAVANKLEEIWFGPQPFVIYCYLAQYFPTFFRRHVVPSIFQKDHIAKLRDG
ncbi:hypothetical protein V5799_017744 [Amblyomma americanum]|uniref:Hydroxysteroid 17-beta dehydrogenase 11 n=1 Tax=Amblyomma americanum TaxID=6943 RepID=A0AAQ4F1R5_AMBAM